MKILTDTGLMVLWQRIKDLYKKISVSAKQTTISTEDGGTNVMTFTFGDGTSTTLSVKNGSKGSDGAKGETGAKGEKGDRGDRGPVGETGPQGNSGIADASNKALINDAVTGGETSYLSAEVGKLGILTYDCSKGGTIEHASLQDAINAVPTTFRKVGITIIYKSGDSIYRYALKSNSWSTDSTNWFSVEEKVSDLQQKTHYINGLDCAKELYIFNNEVGIKDLHLGYRNHNNTWFLVFFNDSKSVAQTDVYKEEIGGIIPIYKLENGSLAEVIGYIDVDWSALNEGANAIVKELLPPAFDRYSNPNISNLIQYSDSSYIAKNLLTPNSFSQVTQFATWNLEEDIWKLVSYKATGNALYKSFERDNPLLKSGHVFYFCENMKSNAECRFIAQIDSTNSSVCIHSGSGEYEFMSNVLKINYSGGGNNLLVVAARLIESVSVIEVKDFMMIDLTDIFGKNNEPSKEYMDFLFKMRMPTFYGEKNLFTSENFAIKELCDKVNDLTVSSNNMAQGRITSDMFKEENKNILINALNESIGDFVKINKTNDVCVRYVTLDDDTHEIYSKINYSLRKKILFDGLSDDAKANAINARSIERIYRFADAKCLSDLDRDFSVKSNIDGGEPSAIVSKDGSTLYLYSYLKRYSSYDGFVWSEPEYLKCGGVKMADRGNGHYLMHCNVNLIDGVYYLTGCRQNLGGELLLYTSKDGINFEYVGIALEANHKVGDFSAKNWGNTYMIKDYGTGYYYLYFEFEDDNIHWNTAVVRSLNPLDGSWKNCKEDVIIKPAYQSSHANSNMFGCGNVDFVKGMDNQPIKFNGRFYMYYHGTCYKRDKHFNQSNIMRAYSYNLIDWFDEGVILDIRKKPSDIISTDGEKTDGDNTSGNADHCVIEFKGKSYMFYSYDINHAEGMERIYTVMDSRRFIELLKLFP